MWPWMTPRKPPCALRRSEQRRSVSWFTGFGAPGFRGGGVLQKKQTSALVAVSPKAHTARKRRFSMTDSEKASLRSAAEKAERDYLGGIPGYAGMTIAAHAVLALLDENAALDRIVKKTCNCCDGSCR